MKYLTEEMFSDIKETIYLYINLSRYEAAETILKTSVSEYGRQARFSFLEAILYHKQGLFSQAIAKYDEVIRDDEFCEEALFNKMILLSDLGSYEEAKKTFDQLDGLVQSENAMNEKLAKEQVKLARIFEEYNIEDKTL